MVKAKRFCIVVLVLVLLTTLFPSVDIFVPSAEALTSSQQKKQDKAVKEYMSKIDSSMMPFEKAYVLYKELCNTVWYDWEHENPNRHKAYGALVDKVAVCDGYSYAYELLLNKAGIKNIIVVGKLYGGSHSWNMIELYGKWYHVDVTNGMFLWTDSKLSEMCTWTKKKTTPKNGIFGKDVSFDEYIAKSKVVILNFLSDSGKEGYYSINEKKVYTVTSKAKRAVYTDTEMLFQVQGEEVIKKHTYKTHKTTTFFTTKIQKYDSIQWFETGRDWESDMMYVGYMLNGVEYTCAYNMKTKKKVSYESDESDESDFEEYVGKLGAVGDYILFVATTEEYATSGNIRALSMDTGEIKTSKALMSSASPFDVLQNYPPECVGYNGRLYYFDGKDVYRYIPATNKIKKIKTFGEPVYYVGITKSGNTSYLTCELKSGKTKRIKLA